MLGNSLPDHSERPLEEWDHSWCLANVGNYWSFSCSSRLSLFYSPSSSSALLLLLRPNVGPVCHRFKHANTCKLLVILPCKLKPHASDNNEVIYSIPAVRTVTRVACVRKKIQWLLHRQNLLRMKRPFSFVSPSPQYRSLIISIAFTLTLTRPRADQTVN